MVDFPGLPVTTVLAVGVHVVILLSAEVAAMVRLQSVVMTMDVLQMPGFPVTKSESIIERMKRHSKRTSRHGSRG